MLLAIRATQVKLESKKEVLKKEKKGYEKFASRDSNPDPQNQLELKVIASSHWTTSVNAYKASLYSFSMVIGSLQG